MTPSLDPEYARRFLAAVAAAERAGYHKDGSTVSSVKGQKSALRIAAEQLGVKPQSMHSHLLACQRAAGDGVSFETSPLQEPTLPTPEIIAQRKRKYEHRHAAESSRLLVPVKVKLPGPIGIVHFGDPHVDDDGTDIALIEKHINLVNKTPGMFGANVGDLQNNWVGRLSFLWAQQSTSAAEAWALTEWLVKAVPWLYLVRGNHDMWSGEGDPVTWMMRGTPSITDAWGVRLALNFPNGKTVRVNARHDFTGRSMWNTAHGPAKAVQMGWRDHILTCGHIHTAGYQVLKDPATGLISHAIRVGSYKTHDRFAHERGLPNQNIFPACVTIIDPRYEDDDPRLVTTLFDVERGAEFLTYLRKQ